MLQTYHFFVIQFVDLTKTNKNLTKSSKQSRRLENHQMGRFSGVGGPAAQHSEPIFLCNHYRCYPTNKTPNHVRSARAHMTHVRTTL
jgi:hypothetical protein